MTERANTGGGASPLPIAADQRARLAQLQRRRPSPTVAVAGASALAGAGTAAARARPRPRRPHPARGGRIAAAGLGIATTLGLVGLMGLLSQRASNEPSPAATAPATLPLKSVSGVVSTGAISAPPFARTAQPIVRQAPSAPTGADPTPIAQTNGSR